MSAIANPYGPQTDADRAANEAAARRAVAYVTQMYPTEAKGRPLNRRLRAAGPRRPVDPLAEPPGRGRPLVSAIEIHGDRVGDRAVGKPRIGRMQSTGPELGSQVRAALWRFSASTRTEGAARDRLGVATVCSQYPITKGLFSDAALMAVLRPPEPSGCSWDHYRKLARDLGEPPPEPGGAHQADLEGLLGRPCRGCKTHFAAQVVAAREDAYVASLVAAGYQAEDAAYQRPGDPRATGTIRATPGASHPHYYQPGRPR
jgi:hypothetical protein